MKSEFLLVVLFGRCFTRFTATLPYDRHACHEVAAIGTEQTHTTCLDLLCFTAVVGTAAAFAASMLHLLASLAAGCWINVDLAELHAITRRSYFTGAATEATPTLALVVVLPDGVTPAVFAGV